MQRRPRSPTARVHLFTGEIPLPVKSRPYQLPGLSIMAGFATHSPPKRCANACASSGFAKQNTAKLWSQRRREYVSDATDRCQPRTASAGSATWCGHRRGSGPRRSRPCGGSWFAHSTRSRTGAPRSASDSMYEIRGYSWHVWSATPGFSTNGQILDTQVEALEAGRRRSDLPGDSVRGPDRSGAAGEGDRRFADRRHADRDPARPARQIDAGPAQILSTPWPRRVPRSNRSSMLGPTPPPRMVACCWSLAVLPNSNGS